MKFDRFAKKARRLKTTCFIVKNDVLEVSKSELFLPRIGPILRLEKNRQKRRPRAEKEVENGSRNRPKTRKRRKKGGPKKERKK